MIFLTNKNNFLKSILNDKKIIALLVLGIIVLIGLPVTIYLVQQRQNLQQQASSIGARDYPCGGVTIKVYASETPSCSNGTVSGLPSYLTTFVVGLETNPESYGTYTVKWGIEANFCSTESSSAPCFNTVNNPAVTTGIGTIFNNGDTNQAKYVYAGAGVVAPPSPYKACGYYQNDMSFQIYNSNGGFVCSYGSMTNPNNNNADYSYCHSGLTCNVQPTPTNTPSPSPSASPTPTTPPVPDLTSTPTPTLGITPLPSGTPIPTDTPTITPTGTITPSPILTVTPTPPPGSTDTPTSSVTIIVIKKTLPSTGPGGTFINLGIFGGLATIIGGLILFGL